MLCGVFTTTVEKVDVLNRICSVPSFTGADPPSQLSPVVQLVFVPKPDQTTSAWAKTAPRKTNKVTAIAHRQRARRIMANFSRKPLAPARVFKGEAARGKNFSVRLRNR